MTTLSQIQMHDAVPVLPVRLLAGRHLSAVLLTSLLAGTLTGCSMVPRSAASPLATVGAAVGGNVHGGQQPVIGSSIALYATSSGGYNAAPVLLATATTGAGGQFNITTSYTCPANQQAYLTAAGGNPGLSGTVDNSAIFLVAALGACSNLSATTFVNVNEATTVSAAYALSGFTAPGGAGFTEANTTAGFSTSATNLQGLTDAFANAANLVNVGSGVALTVPASTASGTAPQTGVNTIADILQDCVNSATPSGCTSLSAAATPPTGSGIVAPVNVFQAVLDIAQYPGNNVLTLYGLVSAAAAFEPTYASQPNDLSLALTFTGGQLATAQGLTIDDNDNVWVSGSTYASLVEFSPQGVALSPVGATPTTQAGWTPSIVSSAHTIRNLSFDSTGNLWLPDSSTPQVYEYVPGGTSSAPTTGAVTAMPYTSANQNLGTAYDLGIDNSGNVWFGSYKKNACANTAGALCAYVELQKSGSSYTPTSTFNGNTFTLTNSSKTMAVDANPSSPGFGNVWIAPNSTSSVQIFQKPYTSTPLLASLSSTAYSPQGMAIDGSGNAWIATFSANKLFEVSPGGTLLTTITNANELEEPNFVTIDGNGNLFMPNFLTSTVAVYSPSFNSNAGTFLSPNTGLNPGATLNQAGTKYTGGVLNGTVETGVDRAGSLWVLNQSVGSVVQILGVAAPVRPVLAQGQYGVKP